MPTSSIRIPFPGPLPPAIIIPPSAHTVTGAIDAISSFLTAPPSPYLRGVNVRGHSQAVVLTGAGISVASGLSDYRGEQGTYTRNKYYRPIFFHEFVAQHEARKRYWARSYVGWPRLLKAKPNATHWAIRDLSLKGYLSSVITQNVDSFHTIAHPELPTVELHGYLRSVVCINCRNQFPRSEFQKSLERLNPAWAEFLEWIVSTGAFETDDPEEQREKGLKLNPDGDVELPGAPYSTFRYPSCPTCLERPPRMEDGTSSRIEVESDGAWSPSSNAGILKPAVTMFGENVDPRMREAAEGAIQEADRLLVIGSSLAANSAWRLVEQAHKRGMPIGIINVGGVRNESLLFGSAPEAGSAVAQHVRCSLEAESVVPSVASRLPTRGG